MTDRPAEVEDKSDRRKRVSMMIHKFVAGVILQTQIAGDAATGSRRPSRRGFPMLLCFPVTTAVATYLAANFRVCTLPGDTGAVARSPGVC